MFFLSRGFFSVVFWAGLALLAGCATDAPQRVEGSSPARSLPQAGKSLGTGWVEAVRPVGVETTRARALPSSDFKPPLARLSAPSSADVELSVRLDNGESVKVVQTAGLVFRPGDRVRVMQQHDGAVRVTY